MKRFLFNLLLAIALISSFIIPAIPVQATSTNLSLTGEGTDADGAYTGGSANYTNLNSDDADTSNWYVTTNGVSFATYYHSWKVTSSLPSGATIDNVTLYYKAYTFSGTSTFAPYYRSGATRASGDPQALTYSYVLYGKSWGNINPITGLNWTEADLNSGEWGLSSDTSYMYPYNYTRYCTYMYLEVAYTVVGVPTVTTSATSSILATTATGNGNITVTGGSNSTKRGICYSSVNNPPTTADSKVEESGSFGTGAFTEALTGLTAGTTYYARAYAINVSGTGYGSTDTFNTASLSWYSSSWLYRKSFTISHASGALTNYQWPVHFIYGSGANTTENYDNLTISKIYLGSHSKIDFSDIIVTASDGLTVQSRWAENVTSSSGAYIWFKFSSIGTTPTTYYAYYGNSGATATDNGTATFDFFDDFSGTSLNAQWNVTQGAPSVSGGAITLSDATLGSNDGIKATGTSFLYNIRLRARYKVSTDTNHEIGLSNANLNQTYAATGDWIFIIKSASANIFKGGVGNNGTATSTSGDTGALNTYEISEIKFISSDARWVFNNNNTYSDLAANTPDENIYPRINAAESEASGTLIVDWYYIAKYDSADPVFGSWGSEVGKATVTLSAASSVENITATLNGNITATGNDNPVVTVYWGTTDGGTNSANWQYNSVPTSPAQPQTAAAFYYNAASLPTGTTIYFSASATNVAGKSWPASSSSFLTKPAAPTNVQATDGTSSTSVTITWINSTGATAYHIWRGASDLGTQSSGYSDTGAGAPTLAGGTATASDGTSYSFVTLTSTGESVTVGTTATYYVVASNATGNSSNSLSDTGYRGNMVPITYQWWRSAADSDASFSSLAGATTNPFDDTTGAFSPDARYYYCVENATGTGGAVTNHDRGYISTFGAPSVTTLGCTGFTASQAVLNGVVTAQGDAAVSIYGFDYGLTTGYGSSITTTYPIANGVAFWSAPNTLLPATQYHFRAKAYNSVWGYGSDATLSTIGSPVEYENLSTGQDGNSDNISGSTWVYMQFTAQSMSHTVTSLQVYIKRIGTGTVGTCTIGLFHASGGAPTGNVLASTTFSGDVITTAYQMYSFPITETAIQGGNQYAIVLAAPNAVNPTGLQWGVVNAGALANAVKGYSSNGGLSWTSSAPKDALFAIWGNPALEVYGANVFTGYRDTGDWLIVADTNNVYMPYYPNSDPQTLFQVQLISGATVVASTSVKAWQRQPVGIYLNPSTAGTLTWGAGYKVRIALASGATILGEYALQTADWQAGDLIYLDGYIRNLANIYQAYYTTLTGVTVTYLIASTSGDVLNVDGGAIFQRGIVDIAYVRPNIFQYVQAPQQPIIIPPSTGTGASRIVMVDRIGPELYGFVSGMANALGMPDAQTFVGDLLIGLWILTALVFMGSNASMAGIAGAVIAGSFWMGIGILIIGGAWFITVCILSFLAGIGIIIGITQGWF